MKIKKRYRYGFIVLLLLCALLLGGRAFFLHTVKEKLAEKLGELNKAGFSVSYDTLYVNWGKNQITFEKMMLRQSKSDNSCNDAEYFSADKITIDDFGVLTLVFSKEIDVEQIEIVKPRLKFRSGARPKRRSNEKEKSQKSLPIRIGSLLAFDFVVEYADSSTCKTVTTWKTGFELHGLRIDLDDPSGHQWDLEHIRLSNTRIEQPDKPYNFTIHAFDYRSTARELSVDTLKIIPNFSKLAFGRTLGHDLDRIDGTVPFFRIKDLTIDKRDSLAFHAGSIETQFFLKIFHDKRLPHKDHERLLPVQRLLSLPFGLNIDSMKVLKSYISYEEVPEGSDEAGTVYFDNLYASIYHITSDRRAKENVLMMEAQSDFMGDGALKVKASFPQDVKQPSRLSGSLRDFHFHKLNVMMEPAANARIESGVLNALTFRFAYNDLRSDGEVELNYSGLRIITLRDEAALEKAKSKKRNRNKSKEELRKHPLKTFVLNAFILKKDMDESLPEEKRTGTVLFYRDKERSLFNYWWKSLLSGIKSAFRLDRFENPENQKK